MKRKVLNKLIVTRYKVSREWKKYRTKKKHILGLKRLPIELKKGLIDEARTVTKSNISEQYSDYRGFKFGVTHSSPYNDFSFEKKHLTYGNVKAKTYGTVQKYYKARRSFDENDLDTLIPKILDEPRCIGVLLIFKIKDEDNDLIMYVSDYITKGLMNKLTVSLYEHLSFKLLNSKSVQEYELLNIYIRVIYENTKADS